MNIDLHVFRVLTYMLFLIQSGETTLKAVDPILHMALRQYGEEFLRNDSSSTQILKNATKFVPSSSVPIV